MRKMILLSVMILTIVCGIGITTIAGDQDKLTTEEWKASSCVQLATLDKSLYYYDLSLKFIAELVPEDQAYKNHLLGRLMQVAPDIYTKETVAILDNMIILGQQKNVDLFNKITADIKASQLKEIDKHYLLNEIAGWGIQ